MGSDYRMTPFETESMDGIEERKLSVEKKIREKHPRKVDLYPLIRKNDGEYKSYFMQAYHCKCAYCGISIDIIPKETFQIDHVIFEKAPQFQGKKSDAGRMSNLVLSCYTCNHSKSSFPISEKNLSNLHPDFPGIKSVFYRDTSYTIRVAEAFKNDSEIQAFYDKLNLGGQFRRLDYLLMCLSGIQKKLLSSEPCNQALLQEVDRLINFLKGKRNL